MAVLSASCGAAVAQDRGWRPHVARNLERQAFVNTPSTKAAKSPTTAPAATTTDTPPLRQTALHALHLEMGGKMVPFAGYAMPLHYAAGILKEHLHTRAAAGLFDVSHMGQYVLSAPSGLAEMFETLVPGNIAGLKPGRMRYTQLTNAKGGIIDDLMVTNMGADEGGERLLLVLNAACKQADAAHIRNQLQGRAALEERDERALLALQGPQAARVLARFFPGCEDLSFLSWRAFPQTEHGDVWVSRSGYTGEDGFEISLPAEYAEVLARALLAEPEVQPVGLGARDSLRLEAGLCLYGHDIDTTTSPVEAGLAWSIGRRRRETGGFPGAERILAELAHGPARRLVGLQPEGRVPAREGAEIRTPEGTTVGRVTSGGFAPTLGRPIALGYVEAAFATPGHQLNLLVRGRELPARVVDTPFVTTRYFRKKSKP